MTVRIIPLGGVAEIGKNITVFETDNDMVVVDCGMTFPREKGMFGVDIILPDFTYIVERAQKLRAVILTHGHEDHIGALPYLLKQVTVPQVLGTRFTLALLKAKADEHGVVGATEWREVTPQDDAIEIGDFDVEFIRVAHSIPDAVAVALHSEDGTIVHSGDIKLDSSPLDGEHTDLGAFAELGADGVDLYLGDSTNADVPGHSTSERTLAGPLLDIVRRARGRVIATAFSSHIHRLRQLLDIADQCDRVVCILGRSMTRNTNIARNLGYLDVPDGLLIKPSRLADFEPHEVLVLCTGSQGEPLAALSRIASGTHQHVEPLPDDTVIFSSRTIPGNEVSVHQIQNQLSETGSHLYHSENALVHASGHGASEELKTVLQLVRPSAFMPVHGEWRHMRAHAELAVDVGVAPEAIHFGANGRVLTLKQGAVRLTEERVTVGQRLVDRHSNEDILAEILEDRQQASGDGLLVVVARLDHHDGTSQLDLIVRGMTEEDGIRQRALRAAETAIREADVDQYAHDHLERAVRDAVADAIFQQTRRSPLVVPVLLEA